MNFQFGDRQAIWTIQKINYLINLYKSNPCLYNSTALGYKDNTMRQNVWQHIAQLLEMPKDDVVKKVRGLRTQYAREKAKVAARAKEGHPLINPWTYYEALSFLDEFVSVKKNSDSNEPASELFHESAEVLSNHDEESRDNSATLSLAVCERIKNEVNEDNEDDCIMIVGAAGQHQQLHAHQSLLEQTNRIHSFNRAAKPSNKRKRSNPTTVKSPSLISKATSPSIMKTNRFQLPSTSKEATSPPQRTPAQVLSTAFSKNVQSSAKDDQSPVSSTNEASEAARPASSDDDDNIFAKYILSELRQIKDAHVKRVVKHRIQNIIFEAHCSLQT